jgi:hypothetical protein
MSNASGCTHLWLQSAVPLGYWPLPVFTYLKKSQLTTELPILQNIAEWHFVVINVSNRCVPPRSSTTVKLELLPLTDGIITLDTLQITAREKGNIFIKKTNLQKKCWFGS